MRRKIIMIATVFVIAMVGGFLWVKNKLDRYAADNSTSSQLAPGIQQYFGNGQTLESYPYNRGAANWGNNYLVLENGGNGISVRYNSNWNKKLHTEGNFPGEKVKGLVIITVQNKHLGEYVNKSGTKVAHATQRNYIIHFFDMEKRTVIARDTLIGEEPADTKRSTGSGLGDLPKEQAVIDIIKARIK